jgi:hypothetical protein
LGQVASWPCDIEGYNLQQVNGELVAILNRLLDEAGVLSPAQQRELQQRRAQLQAKAKQLTEAASGGQPSASSLGRSTTAAPSVFSPHGRSPHTPAAAMGSFYGGSGEHTANLRCDRHHDTATHTFRSITSQSKVTFLHRQVRFIVCRKFVQLPLRCPNLFLSLPRRLESD